MQPETVIREYLKENIYCCCFCLNLSANSSTGGQYASCKLSNADKILPFFFKVNNLPPFILQEQTKNESLLKHSDNNFKIQSFFLVPFNQEMIYLLIWFYLSNFEKYQ